MSRRSPNRRMLAVPLLLVAACTGGVNTSVNNGHKTPGHHDDDNNPPPPPPPDTCDPTAPVSVDPLRRLSAAQYENTLRDLFVAPLGASFDATTVAASQLSALPVDDAGGAEFTELDARLSDVHVAVFYDVADTLSRAVTSDSNRQALAGDCAVAAFDAACMDALLDTLGVRAFRRPLDTDERARFHELDDGTRDAAELARAVVFTLLMSPQFLYRVEVNGAPVADDPDLLDLDAYELASRLSYQFWRTMPDDELFASAASGALLTEDGYEEQLTRVFEDPRTSAVTRRFYEEWFRPNRVSQLPDNPAMVAVAAGTTVMDDGGDAYLADAANEVLDLADHYTWTVDGTMQDILESNLSFARTDGLAAIYGVAPWDGVSPPPTLPAAERAGLLTRAAFLVSGISSTHPIHRGAFVRRNMLCDALSPPDPADLPPGSLTPPLPDDTQTTRERFASKTAGPVCQACHAYINPIGYTLEQYDALGRFRTEERIFDEVDGSLLATLPVDASAAPEIEFDDATVVQGGVGLSAQVAASNKIESCFASKYFRYSFGREETGADACALEAVTDALENGGNLREAFAAIAQAPAFKQRRIQ